MHTWKPDAYGEAPGIVGTLLAGGVTSCAFLAILRVYQICRAGPTPSSPGEIMIFMGLLSMAVAAVFMVRQRDFKRMLAYSSVEHMGILVLGIGIGGLAVYGALLHLINNGLTKGVLFLSAGNIHRAYGSKVTDDVRGAIQCVPLSGGLFLAGFLAITGSPPFGPFVSEFTIASAAAGGGHYVAFGLFLLLLGVVFVGMGATVLAVVQGKPPGARRPTAIATMPPPAFRSCSSWRLCCFWACISRRLWNRSCARPPQVLGGDTMSDRRFRGRCGRAKRSRAARFRNCPLPTFSEIVVDAVAGGQRVAALFGDVPAATENVDLYAVLADSKPRALRVGKTTLESDRFPSLTPRCPQVHLFEREIAEQYGVRPEGHPWFKPVRFHTSYRRGHDAWGRTAG